MQSRERRKILQVTKARFPPEIRVVKEALSLHDGGYECAVLCPPYEGQCESETWEGIRVLRPSVLRQRSAADRVLGEGLFLSPAWLKATRWAIKEYTPSALHVHDIWLGRAAWAARSQEKLIMDLHENMPAAVLEYRNGYRGLQWWFRVLFHNRLRVLRYERRLLEHAHLVLVVAQEARERVLMEHRHLNAGKVVNVENLESKRFIAEPGAGRAAFAKDHFSVLYVGGFGPHRGVDTLVRAAACIRSIRPDIRFQLIGAQPSQYLDMLKDLIVSLGVQAQVAITPWIPACDVLANIQAADVCCVPHHSNPHTDSTIPHKLFQYMIARRPLLVSTSKPLARTVRQADAGLIFEAGNPEDCASKLLELANNPDCAKRFSNNGFQYVMEQGHNWEDESAPCLIAAYDRVFRLNARLSSGLRPDP